MDASVAVTQDFGSVVNQREAESPRRSYCRLGAVSNVQLGRVVDVEWCVISKRRAASGIWASEKLGVAKPMLKATNMKRKATHLSQDSKKVLHFQKLGRFSVRCWARTAGRATSRRRRECGGVARGLVSACRYWTPASSTWAAKSIGGQRAHARRGRAAMI